MPDLGPMGRGGARRRTRRRMSMMQSNDQGEDQPEEQINDADTEESMKKLLKLAKLLKDKGVISESEYNLIFD